MEWILPKGIVTNSAKIEPSIKRIDTDPLDLADIAKIWKVYTTTKRRLLDPTAERLENYWWRIWGSRKRELQGATVARLFAQISDGQSFVPLRGPSNRDDGVQPLLPETRLGPAASSTTAIHHDDRSRPSTTASSSVSKGTVMPHPILKKTRGPSATGPRPTARFISPHESEVDSERSAPVSPSTHTPMDAASALSRSKGDKKPTKKKGGFVASTAAKKKRPSAVRRPSSQTSQTSQSSTDGGKGPNHDRAIVAPSSDPAGRGNSHLSPPPQDSPSSEEESTYISSRKSKPRQASPLSPRMLPLEARKRMASLRSSSSTSTQGVRNGQSIQVPRPDGLPLNGSGDGVPKILAPMSPTRPAKEMPSLGSRPAGKSDSQGLGAIRLLASEGKSKSQISLAPTLTSGVGRLDLGDSTAQAHGYTGLNAMPPDEKARESSEFGIGSFMKRPMQSTSRIITAPASTTRADQLATSKSQLTFLLEKDRVRGKESKKNRKGSI